MSDTKHISMRLGEDILARVDAEAKRMRWSRNAALNTCVEFGLLDLELERGPRVPVKNAEEKENGAIKQIETVGSSGTDKIVGGDVRGAEILGIRKQRSERHGNRRGAGGVESGHGVGAGDFVGEVGGTEKNAVSAGWFPNSMCPHKYANSFVCKREKGGC
jgi:hypothetical protein